MKGIILSGDAGTGLSPLTDAVPKQLLPLYNKPMIYYPIETLAKAGISEILIITTPKHQILFKDALGDGSKWGVHLQFAVQEQANGIAEALTIGRDFIDREGVCLITGDTVLVGDSLEGYIKQAQRAIYISGSATIFSKSETSDDQYGKILKDNKGKNAAVVGDTECALYNSIIGLYVYPYDAIFKVDELDYSERGRKEITELNNMYFKQNKPKYMTIFGSN